MEIFEIPLYDDDVLKLMFRLAVNFAVVGTLIQCVYCRYTRSKEYLFNFYVLNILVFFICFTLKKFDLGLGMALGLFAIFGILRYRTTTIPIKEMTYLFTCIGLAVINSLANKQMSYLEWALTDFTIVTTAALLEGLLFRAQELRETILYERSDLVHPDKHAELITDIRQRTGLNPSRLELGKINFMTDTVTIDVYYHPCDQEPTGQDGPQVTLVTRED